MEKVNYIPFLKMKDSEISALISLEDDEKEEIIPFFDFPRRDEKKTRDPLAVSKSKEEVFISGVARSSSRISKKLNKISKFYLDDFDVDYDLKPQGRDTYIQLIEEFSSLGMIPVTGVDRSDDHHDNIRYAIDNGLISKDEIALRFLKEDFEDFDYIKEDILEIFDYYVSEFESVDIVLDCRIVINELVSDISNYIISFVKKYLASFPLRKVIVTGSMIPPSIGEVIGTNDEKSLIRKEVEIFKNVKSGLDRNIIIGDYTCVSPEYSDADFFAEDMQNVMTGKVIYPIGIMSVADSVLFLRGSRLKSDKTQFCSLCGSLVYGKWKSHFRGNSYSFGDEFIELCASKQKTNVTASTIVKPIVNAHIRHMMLASSHF